MAKRRAKKNPSVEKELSWSEFMVAEEQTHYGAGQVPQEFWTDNEHHARIYQGDTFLLLDHFATNYPNGIFDMIFADPPYFLSNGGITCQAGKMVSVNKGDWDKRGTIDQMHDFNYRWLSLAQRVLKPNGTIWVTGTHHVIFSVGYAMQQLGFKALNDIAWEKPNPPPNLSCRYFTHSTETVIWAAKTTKSKHCFNYRQMREMAGGKQMKTVWKILPPTNDEKKYGKHPTQKPVALVERCIRASTHEGAMVLDPFMGTGATLIAALNTRTRFIGIDLDPQWLQIAQKRAIENIAVQTERELEHAR